MYNKIKIIIVLLLTCIPSFAQEIFTLDKCKELALQNNRKIRNSRLEIEKAEQTKKDAFTNYFPSAEISGLGFKAKDPILSANMMGMPIELLDDGLAGALVVTQPIFTGGKIVYGNKLTKLGIEVAEQQLKLSDNEILLKTENLFWQLISLYEKETTIDILEQQVDTLLRNVQVAHDAGIITLNDVLQVKLKSNELKSSKVNLDNGIALTKMALCQNIGVEIDTYENMEIERPDVSNYVSPLNIYVDHRKALENRAENSLLEKGVYASKLQTKLKRADYMPTVAVGATFYKQNFMDSWAGNGVAFVSVKIPLSGWWGGSHAIKKQKINEQIAYNDRIEGQEQLLLQMQQVKNEVDNAFKQILIAEESIEQASENLRLNNDYYKVGTVNISDVLDAQSLLQQSRDRYVDMYAQYQKKIFEYLIVTGR